MNSAQTPFDHEPDDENDDRLGRHPSIEDAAYGDDHHNENPQADHKRN